MTDFIFQTSPWFIPLCLLLGAAYAYLLYSPTPQWSKTMNYLLAFLRFALGSLVAFLLLNLMLRLVTQSTDKKTVILAIDNSASMLADAAKNQTPATISALQNLKEALENKDFTVEVVADSTTDLASVKFNRQTTNLSELLGNIKNNYEGRNITDVVLLSDGIYNQGSSPTFGKYPFAIQTLGIGDTIPKRDVLLKNVFSNKVAYLGNQFPLQADVLANGFAGKTTNVLLKQGVKVLETKAVSFVTANALQTVSFQTTATAKGLQHYTVEVQPLAGEHSTRNNRQEVYIEVIDGKEKILLLALAPHPDIKALKSIIEKNENYDLDIKVVGGYTPGIEQEKKYDLVILHQLPDFFSTGNDLVQKYLKQNTPLFFILGNQSSTTQLNNLQQMFQITSGAGQTDRVTGFFNPNFKQINFDSEKLELTKKLPQMSVPFGEYRLLPNAEIVLYQRVGAVQTQKPLLVLGTGAKKGAMLLGEGLWGWRLEEYALTEKQEVIDDLILKTIQYISAKDDNRKLRVYPTSNEFLYGEKAIFETEVYNDIYEKLYNQTIRLDLSNERGQTRSYTYTNTEGNSRFEISALPQGVYRYKATAKVLGKDEAATGEFVVKDLQLENLNTTADHNLLRQLATQAGGRFYTANALAQLQAQLLARNTPDRVSSSEELRELINLRWLFFLILALATAEWVLRKYLGGY